eukprot:CAMPEP_0175134896 /NCGR_PEP_ID=MMETSP0087-20121206/8424_1 /TAXON_ID=136419 /ORGANISM="Unknown Unknown, Strain D1" /LENGTH=335 /DNA_ID=CAMNT_0016417491 /DNA_START=6 /DNA_END=1014 /DNA_ORIENTATION=+
MVFVSGMKCKSCGVDTDGSFSQSQVKKYQADKSFEPTCKACNKANEEKAKWAGNFECSKCGRKRLVAAEFSQTQIQKKRLNPILLLTCIQCVKAAGPSKETEVDLEDGKEEAKEEVKTVEFSAGKLGLSIEKNAVNKEPSPESQAGQLGVKVGWVISHINGKQAPATKADILKEVAAQSEKGSKPVRFDFRVPCEGYHCCSQCGQMILGSFFTGAQLRNRGPGKQRCRKCVEQTEGESEREQQHSRFAKLEEARLAAKKASACGSVREQLIAASLECAVEAELVTGLKPMVLDEEGGEGQAEAKQVLLEAGGGSTSLGLPRTFSFNRTFCSGLWR